MKIKKSIGFASLLFASLFSSCGVEKTTEPEKLTAYVDTYIGTGEHGHVFLGANVPFGLVQLGPTNIPQTWDWTSGYHISDSTIIGFSHMHLSGTGIGDLVDVNIMPAVGEVKLDRGNVESQESGFYSLFRRETEKTRPGYYAVHLDRYGIDVELTATKRVGYHQYIFPKSTESKIIIDLENGHCWDEPVETYLVQENDTVISGYRFSTGWAKDQRVFFTAVFSKPIKGLLLSDKEELKEGNALKAKRVYGQVFFDTDENEMIALKVALSSVSIENAKMNMQAELPHWCFEKTVDEADKAWNEELNKIKITTDDNKIRRIFYTAMYHTMIAPSEFCDVNGDYYGSDQKMHKNPNFKNYSTFSLWDTYRAAHPLMTIIHPEKMSDIINTMLQIYKEQGKLPVWHFMGCETDCMIGNPGISVVADAVLKGYDGFDKELAYEAMKNSAMLDERGLKFLKEYNYIPYEKESEGLSKAMEYAIADWSVAQVAKSMGKNEDYNYFNERSKVYRYYFDKETKFMRGLSADGKFRPTFNAFESVHRDNDYAEGNAWQYIWLVPHDIDGLVDMFGGKQPFIEKLDSLFLVDGDLGEHASPDITGLIGQYAHGNEPSHHVVYIYSYLGEAWKTAEKVREITEQLYDDTPGGICGNEDVGQMSAWYILSSLGFYQVEPAGGKFVFGSPIVDKAELKVQDGKIFTIIAHNNSKENKYIQSILLNGAPYHNYYIDFKDIASGGKLEFEMGDKPSETWGLGDFMKN